jgi:uncharacterized membrane protein YdfJ with MMPL/SSD domain
VKFLLSPVVLPRWVAAATVAIVLVPVLQDPAAAAPGPSRRELTAQQKKLGDQLEKITEQYNGLRLQLTQAKRAAKSASDTADRQSRELDTVRQQVVKLAVESYKNGSSGSLSLQTAENPQTLLDQTAVLNYFSSRGDDQFKLLAQALQGSNRSRKAALDRLDRVNGLAKDAEKKREDIRALLTKVKGRLGEATPLPEPSAPSAPSAPPAPKVDPGESSTKAAGAVRAAPV